MTLRGEWLVLCERVLVDSQSGNVSLVDCLDQVNAPFFPTEHHRFAVAAKFRWVDDALPSADVDIQYRLVRASTHTPEEVIVEVGGVWRAGTQRGRVNLSFGTLRLLRPETVTFRMDHRMADGDWVPGPSSLLDIVQMELTREQRAELRSAFAAQGQPVSESLVD